MNHKIIILVILGLFLFTFNFVSATCQDTSGFIDIGTFKQGEPMNLRQTCETCTYVNLSSVTIPPSYEMIYINQPMTKTGIEFNYTFSNTTSPGDYFYVVYGDINGGLLSETFCFEVTPSGKELTQPQSLIYFLVTIFAFIIFGILVYIFINMDGSNPRSSETGDITGINYKKYFKVALFPLVYVTFLWFFNFIIGLSENYLGLTLYANTLGFIFMILTKLIIPIILLTVIYEFVLIIKDNNIVKEYKSLWSQY